MTIHRTPLPKPASRADLARALFEEAGDALLLFEPQSNRLLDVNGAALRLSGFARSELLRYRATNLFRREGGGGQKSLQAAANKTGIFPANEEYLLRTSREGVWIPVSINVARLHVQPQTLALITARDVRAQRRTVTQLRRLEVELSQLMASVSACLWSAEIDEAGRWAYRYWSAAVEGLTGRPPAYFFPGPPALGSAGPPRRPPGLGEGPGRLPRRPVGPARVPRGPAPGAGPLGARVHHR